MHYNPAELIKDRLWPDLETVAVGGMSAVAHGECVIGHFLADNNK